MKSSDAAAAEAQALDSMRFPINLTAAIFLVFAFIEIRPAYAQTRWPGDAEHHQIPNDRFAHAPMCRQKKPPLTNRSIGPVRPAQTLQDLERICPALQYAWYGNEGEFTPVVLFRLGKVGLMIEFSGTTASSTIYRISSTDPQLRTTDGFGPGSLLSAMSRVWGRPSFAVGECQLYAWFTERPGLSFRVELPDNWDCLTSVRVEHTGDLSLLPPKTRVREVLLFASDQ